MPSTSSGSRSTTHYVLESTYGVTPATPVFKPLPMTGNSIGITRDTIESEKLRGDRQREDIRLGNKNISGTVPGELEYGIFDEMIESMAMGTWTANVLKTGLTRRSYTLERFFKLDTNEYHRYKGAEVSAMRLQIATSSIVSVEFDFIAQDNEIDTAIIAGATYQTEGDLGFAANEPFDSFTGSISDAGVTLGIVTDMSLDWSNNMQQQFVLMSNLTECPTDGKSILNGSMTVLFQNSDLYNKFINETTTDIILVLQDPAGETYTIDLPRVKYTAGNPDVTDDGPISIPLEFSALYDGTELSQIVITRST